RRRLSATQSGNPRRTGLCNRCAPATEGQSMSVDQPRLSHPTGTTQVPALPRQAIAAVVGFAAIAASGLLWAKWDPYGHKIAHLLTTRSWAGHSILDSAGSASAAPSWHGMWSFARSYGQAVWMALAAALVIAAALEALVP